MLIAVVGDSTLDVTVGPPGPISAGDARAHISMGPGGQGANIAVRLARAGARVRLVAPLADDPAGRVLRGHLETDAVEVVALPAQRTSIVVVLLWGSRGERMMLSDRVSADGDLATALAGCDWVHVSGYLLRDPAEAQRVVTALHAAAIDRVSVAGGSFAGWADAASARDAITETGACLIIVKSSTGKKPDCLRAARRAPPTRRLRLWALRNGWRSSPTGSEDRQPRADRSGQRLPRERL